MRKPGQDGNVNQLILSDISVEFQKGVITAVVGPSGSGKSTLLRQLDGLDPATTGAVYLDGVDTAELDVTTLRRRVGMIFQTPTMFDGTVGENVLCSTKWSASGDAVESAGHYLELVGLSADKAVRDASSLSVGEQQRVAIARCLVTSPEVLLLDEPTAHLDPAAKKQILDLVRNLTGNLGLTAILVTHDIESARMTAERVVVLVEGRIVEAGATDDVLASPTEELTRRFINGELVEAE